LVFHRLMVNDTLIIYTFRFSAKGGGRRWKVGEGALGRGYLLASTLTWLL